MRWKQHKQQKRRVFKKQNYNRNNKNQLHQRADVHKTLNVMFDICLVMLIGVPGSGKTTLSEALVVYLEDSKMLDNCVVVPVSYDSLIPPNLQNHHLWKEARKSILHDVQELINYLRNLELGINSSVLQLSSVVEKILKRTDKEKKRKVVIIVDDNMYYRSMRYEYYQLARQNELGFCQIYIHCDLEDALKRNESRDTAVPAEVVRKMFSNIEPPDPQVNNWEKSSVSIPSSSLTEPNVLTSLVELINRAIQDPVIPRQDLSKLREESQIICSTTVLHQSDIALRKLVAEEINKAKQLGSKKIDLSARAAFLGEVRKKLLNDIRVGVHVIPTDVIKAVEHHEANATSKLHDFLSKLFTVMVVEKSQ